MAARRQEPYLYRDDPKPRIEQWARSLRYFRFVRDGGGMAGAGDHLLLAVRVRTQAELKDVFARLGVTLRPLLPDPAEFGGNGNVRFDGAAPGAIRIGEAVVHAYFLYGRLELRIADEQEPARVTDAAVGAARALEPRIETFADRVIDPPQDDALCVSPRHHPEIWKGPGARRKRSRLWLRVLGWAALAGIVGYAAHAMLG